MSNTLRETYAQALRSTQGDDPLSRLTRAGLETAAAKFSSWGVEAAPPGLSFRIADADAAGSMIAANEAGELLQRVQRAVARLAKARRARMADVARLLPLDLDLARLNVATTSPGSLIVDLQPHVAADDDAAAGRLSPPGASWAEVGAAELVRALPEAPDDDESVDSLASASPVVRRAVADLIYNLPNPKLNIDFTLNRGSGELLRACLTSPQAQSLRERLDIVREEREVVRMRGRLDGLRTRRQIFYFEMPGGTEIHGYVDDSLLAAVRDNLDLEVDIALESFVNRSRSGKRSQRRYRLIEVAGQQSQIPVESDFANEEADSSGGI